MTPKIVSLLLMAAMGTSTLLPSHARAAASAVPASKLSEAQTHRVVMTIADAVRERYVFTDRIEAIVGQLQRSERAGRYRALPAGLLAERISEDLRGTSHDGHLYLRHDPEQSGSLQRSGGPEPTPHPMAGTEPVPGKRVSPAPTPAPAADDAQEQAYWDRLAVRSHHGLAELRVLPGNLRYLRIDRFDWSAIGSALAYDDAMRFLKNGDAAIIDLRGNGGGAVPAPHYLISYFLRANVPIYTFLQRSAPPTQSRSMASLPAGRLLGMPLYVLVDGGTASAAEDFPYNVQQFKLGRIVGERTAGAANNNAIVPVEGGFVLSVSEGRPVHAISHGNWEGTGVMPDIAAPASQALAIAQRAALDALARKPGLDPALLAEYRWASSGVEAQLHPFVVNPFSQRVLAGRYGAIDVAFHDGALWMTRPDRPARRLMPMTADGLYAVEFTERMRIKFDRNRLEILRLEDPEPVAYPKQ